MGAFVNTHLAPISVVLRFCVPFAFGFFLVSRFCVRFAFGFFLVSLKSGRLAFVSVR